jgi:hypothetical protein
MTVKAQNDYCGITKWHEAGITGKGVVVWNTENGKATHGKQTTQRILHAAPDAMVINGSLGMSRNNKEILSSSVTTDDGTRYDVEEFIKTFGIKLVTRSQHGGAKADGVESKFWKPLKEKYNLIFFNSAGNKASDGTNGGLPPDIAIYVAACGLIDGKPKRDHWYSSIGEEVDFIDFRGELTGTSFSAPYLCGKAALLVQKYGQQITQDEVYEYFKSHAQDLEEEGVDNKSGWGLPIMGDPKTVIKMQVGNFKATVDGKTVIMDVAPKIENQRTLVPLRFISEALGAEVGWDDKTKTVTIVR